MTTLNVGDIRIRVSDGVVVEIIHVDGVAETARAMPYVMMVGHRRFSQDPESIGHPDRRLDRPFSDFRDVTDSDIANPAETKAMHT